jgi:tetratricopeptide (TPR) repeat protein
VTPAFALSLAVWNVWVLVWWVVRFHPEPAAMLDAFPANLPWRDFSFAVLAATWWSFLRAAVVVAGLLVLVRRAGAAVAGWCRWRDGDGAPVRFGLGMGLGGSAALGAGLAGLLVAPPRPVSLVVLAVLAAVDAPRLGRDARAAIAGLVADGWAPLSSVLRMVAVLAGVVTLLDLLNVELGWDALTYHLRLASFYLYRHKVYHVWHHYCAWLPSQVQVLYAVVLGTGGEMAVRFLNAVAGAALILAARALARRVRVPAWPAVLLAVSSPVFLNLVARAYVDFTFALFFALSLIGLLQAFDRRGGGLAVSGVFAGFAMASKYQGVLMVAAWLAAAWPRLWRRGGARAGAWWCAAALLPLAPWLLKNWIEWGNPVQPFLGGLFGTHEILPEGFRTGFEAAAPGAAFAASLPVRAEALLANTGSVNGPLMPAVAGLAPLLALRAASARDGLMRRATLGYLAGWFVLCPDARYFLPALPWLGVVVAGPLAGTLAARRPARIWFEAALAFGFLYSAGIQWQFYSPASVPLGMEAPEAKLRRVLAPPPYTAYATEALNARVGLEERVLWLCHFNTYYANRECIADFHFGTAHLTRILREAPTAPGIAKRLRQRGIDWLLSTGTGAVQYADIPGFFDVPDAGWRAWRRMLAERTEPVWQTCEYTLFRVTPPHAVRSLPALPVYEALALRTADAAFAAGKATESLAVYASPPELLRGVGAVAAREGEALALLNRFPEALGAYGRALAAGTDTPRLRADIALVLLRCGKPVIALAYAEEAWRQDPRSAQTAAALAGITATLGRIPEARAWIARARRLAPGTGAYDDLAAQIARVQ